VLFNIESKVDGDFRNLTRSPEDFVAALVEVLKPMGLDLIDRVTHQVPHLSFVVGGASWLTLFSSQSFDWRALIISKEVFPELRTSALVPSLFLYAFGWRSIANDENLQCDDTTLWA
jgi:hypothetical protein